MKSYNVEYFRVTGTGEWVKGKERCNLQIELKDKKVIVAVNTTHQTTPLEELEWRLKAEGAGVVFAISDLSICFHLQKQSKTNLSFFVVTYLIMS